MLSNALNRRHFLKTTVAGAAIVALPLPALALTEAGAKQLVNSVVADINRVIASGKSEKAMLRDFEKIFVQYADVPIMARYALGADARSASPAQLRQFTKAFQGYISRKYGRRFREFIGGQVDVRNARRIKAGYEVRTSVKLQGSSPFDVTFLVSDKSGRDKFYNMFIEGVNLLLTERTEIGAMLDARKGNLNQLIKDLNKTG
ncbi:ABC transporter substrate-binding protein [Ruegeria sp. R13_0]|uniref:MlaC/ttg2D family ABC transporter substrate-binding protein n=1 Tax=Ruegeria sp. R13_0 TaxID=2821099 RepID=UPI001ADB57B7|nr:ABC transporter substrate-binding protein [Ruegeria sp. R13_0]MBO9433898.1 ABC transporter substrate-binding protein [Ruegeria sp. R13_0]